MRRRRGDFRGGGVAVITAIKVIKSDPMLRDEDDDRTLGSPTHSGRRRRRRRRAISLRKMGKHMI